VVDVKDLTHLSQKSYWIKTLAVVIIGGFIVRWALGQNTTLQDYVKAIASTNVFVIVGIELLDKISDRFDYVSAFQAMYKKETNMRWLGGLLIGIGAFFAVLYIMAGTITMSFGTYTPGVVLAAATYALYIIAPETGDDELIFWLWGIAQVATGGAYLAIALDPRTLFKVSTKLTAFTLSRVSG